jgi:hypothetical protein
METGWASRTKPREFEKLFELKEKVKTEKVSNGHTEKITKKSFEFITL